MIKGVNKDLGKGMSFAMSKLIIEQNLKGNIILFNYNLK